MTAHKILIGASIGMGVIFSIWSFDMYSSRGGSTYALVGASTVGATVALIVYLKRFIEKNKG